VKDHKMIFKANIDEEIKFSLPSDREAKDVYDTNDGGTLLPVDFTQEGNVVTLRYKPCNTVYVKMKKQ